LILRSITVSRWGAFTEPVNIEGFTEGINLLEAPNEAGKSTLLEALRMAFFDKHNLTGREIQEIVPWGKRVSPCVEVEFLSNGRDYKIVKQFVEKPFSQLYIDGELYAEGTAADEAILEVVGGTSPGRGLSKTAHLGLAGILWVPHGGVHLTDKPEWDGKLLEGFASPSSVIQGSKEREFQNKLDSKLAEYLTPKGRSKSTSLINQISGDLDSLNAEIAEVFENTQRLEKCSQNVQKSVESQRIIEGELTELEERLSETRSKIDEVSEGIQALQKQESEVEKLARESEALKEKIGRFETLKSEISSMSKRREEIGEDLSGKKIEIKPIEKRMSALSDELRSLKAQDKEKSIDIEKADIHEKLREKAEQLREMEDILREAEEITKKIQELNKEIEKLNAPDEESVKEIKELRERISTLELKLESSGLRLELKPKKSVKGKISLDGKEEKFQATPKKPGEWVAVRTVELNVADVGTLNVASGAAEQEELEEKLTDARMQAEKHPLASFSNTEIDDLLRKERMLEGDISKLQAEYMGKLGKNPKAKLQKAAKLKKEVQRLKKKAGKAEGKTNLSQLKGELEKIKAGQEKLEDEIAEFTRSLEEIKETINSHNLELTKIDTDIKNRREEMNRLNEDGLTQQQRERELKGVLSKLEKEQRKLDGLKEQYGDLPEKLKKDVVRFEKAKAECRKKLDDCKQAVYTTKGEIAHLQEIADHVKLARLKEKRSSLEAQLKEREAYLEGLKLLDERIRVKRGDVAQQVHGPLQKRINQLLRSLTGLKYDGILFDEKLAPTGVQVSGLIEPEPWGRLSYGLREQISVLTRLALGEITGETEKQMVVLDDPLVNTDDQRMVEMFHIFEALSDKLQVVILTCHGRNYRPLSATKLELV